METPRSGPHASALDLVFRSVFTLNWVSGLLLASCFFLPLAKGCSNNVIFPSGLALQAFDELSTKGFFELIAACATAFWIARPYLYGIVLALVIVSAVLVGGPKGLRLMNRLLLGWSCCAVACLLVYLVLLGIDNLTNESPPNGRELMAGIGYWSLIAIPPLALLIIQIMMIRRGKIWLAVTTAQIGWAILAALRFGVWFNPRDALIGGKTALATSLALIEFARLQHVHARFVFDVSLGPRRTQFNIRYLMGVTLMVAIFLTWVLAPLTPS